MIQVKPITDIFSFKNYLRVFELPKTRLIGKSIRHTDETDISPIPRFWTEYYEKYHNVTNVLPRIINTNIAWFGEYEPSNKQFTYMICVICPAETPVPTGFEYRDIHHFGKRVETARRHDYIGRFMKADTPVPDGYAHWDFVPNDNDLPYLTFRSQFAFSVFAGDHDTLHEHKDFDVNALYDITRNIILEEKIIIPYPEIYWTAEVQFDKANGTNYNPENLFCGERMPDACCCGWLFSVCLNGK